MSSFLLYIIPIVVFIILSITMYLISDDSDKNKIGTVMIRNILPSLVVAILVYIIIKFNRRPFDEPVMKGNYFD